MQRSQRPTPCAVATLALALLGGASSAMAHNDGIETRLKGFNEVPQALSTPASGRFKLFLNEKTGAVGYELSYSGFPTNVLMAHIHFGKRGLNGGIMVWLCQTTTNPDPTGRSPTCPQQGGTVTGELRAENVVGPAAQGIAATEFDEVVAAIRAGAGYVNVHSVQYPGGELRGQLRDDD